MKQTEVNEVPVQIPIENLSPDALIGVIQNYILREGTDYGSSEVPLETKVDQILKQLKSGIAELYFDAESQTVTLVRTKK